MERAKEIEKLVNVLRRTSRMAMQSEWTGAGGDAAAFCVEQYNRVLGRLQEIDPDIDLVGGAARQAGRLEDRLQIIGLVRDPGCTDRFPLKVMGRCDPGIRQ